MELDGLGVLLGDKSPWVLKKINVQDHKQVIDVILNMKDVQYLNVRITRYSDESTPPFRAKGRHLFRRKVRKSNSPLSSLISV